MAIRTDEPKIGQPIVVTHTVDVIQLEWDGTTVPSIQAAHLASRLFDSLLDEPSPKVIRLRQSPPHQYDFQRNGWNDWYPMACSPALSHEVGRIKIQLPNSPLEARLIAAAPDLELG
jgi:hypothetical protein